MAPRVVAQTLNIIYLSYYENTDDWSRAFSQYTVACEVYIINQYWVIMLSSKSFQTRPRSSFA